MWLLTTHFIPNVQEDFTEDKPNTVIKQQHWRLRRTSYSVDNLILLLNLTIEFQE